MLPIILLGTKRVVNSFGTKMKRYCWLVIIFIFVVLLSIIGSSWMIFGQPVSIGLVAARKSLFIVSLFYLIALGLDWRELMKLFRYLAYTGALIALLSIMDVFILGVGTIFSEYYAIGQTRGDYLRIHVGTFLVVYATIYAWISFSLGSRKTKKMFYLFMIFLCLLDLIYIAQTRAVIIGLVLSITIYQLWDIDKRKLLINSGVLFIVFFSIVYLSVDYLYNETHLGLLVKETIFEVAEEAGNVLIRKDSLIYYVNYTLEHSPFLGIGKFSSEFFPNNPITFAAERYHYYPVDIRGITTYLYFGVPGVMLLVYLVYFTFRDALKAKKGLHKSEKVMALVILHVLIYIVLTPTLNNLLTENMVMYTGIFIYFLSGYYKRHTKIHRKVNALKL